MVHLNLFPSRPGITLSLALAVLGLAACEPEAPQVVRPTPLPQDPRIQVYMNHEAASTYTEPYRNVSRDGDNFEQILSDRIAQAHSSVDVAVQELRLPGIAAALVKQHRAGVKVRVILENTYARPYSQFTAEEIANLPAREQARYQEARALIDLDQDGALSQAEISQRDALVMLDLAQVPRIDDMADGSAGSDLMHHKFVIVDGQTLIVTSANFTTSDVHGDFKSRHSRGNANNLLVIESAELAALFTEEFNGLWGDGPGGQANSLFGVKKPMRPARSVQVGTTRVEVQFSPTASAIAWNQSSNGLISKTLTTAQRSLQLALFVFSDQTLVDQLEPVAHRGTDIKALIDPGFAYRSYSEALDMLGVALAEECQPEAQNRPWQPAIATVGVPRLTPGDLLHHKFGLVDQQTVITGSHNWTTAANTGNDETVLVIHNNPTVAAHYDREFQRLYTNAILGVPPAIQKKVATSQQQCPIATQSPSTALANPKPPQSSASSAKATRRPPKETAAQNQETASQPATKPPSGTATGATQPGAGQRVNLNTATQAELETLPGIGPALAKRIIAARQKKPFTSLTDLDEISGVGPTLLNKLKHRVEW